jgi:hypothetical protein
MMHSDWFYLFSGYWWLLFPLLSMVWGMIDLWARHRRARYRLDLIKSYVDQGKEPPPELLQYLQKPAEPERERRDRNWTRQGFLYAGLVFAVVAVAFAALTAMQWSHEHELEDGLVFVIVLMTGFSVASFIAAQFEPRPPGSLPPS